MREQHRSGYNLRRRSQDSASPASNPAFGISSVVGRLKWGVHSVWESYLERDCIMSSQQLKRLGEHKYNAQDVSWLDELCMKKFWDQFVRLYPMWLAPNTITLIGLLINITCVLVLSFYSMNAREVAPCWAYALAAVGLFIYQTLDATDGKQARRTNSASPLGELFDHGCDSLSQVFVSLNVCLSMQMGELRYAVLMITTVAVTMFYCAHWSTYCTGLLKFARFDVTEAQMLVISLLLVTATFGSEIWSVSLFGLKLKYLVIGCSLIGSLWQIGGYLNVVFSGGIGKNGSTVADTSVLFPLMPLLAVIVPFVMVYSKSVSGVYDDYIVLYSLCYGFVASKATNRLVIAHMSKSGLEMWDWIYLAPILMMLNQYYDFYVSELRLLCFATAYAFGNILLFCWMICQQFCDYLQIHCFSIDHPHIPKARGERPTTATHRD